MAQCCGRRSTSRLMEGGESSAQEILTIALGIAMAYGPILGLVLARKALGPLNTAAWLVAWGALVPGLEHAAFATSGSRDLAGLQGVGLHSRYHFYMAGIFSLVAAGLIIFVAFTLLREGRPEGWFAVLFALLLGGGFEVSGAAGTLYHGFPPSWAMGLVIYSYPLAWGIALLMSRQYVFTDNSVEKRQM